MVVMSVSKFFNAVAFIVIYTINIQLLSGTSEPNVFPLNLQQPSRTHRHQKLKACLKLSPCQFCTRIT